MNRKSSIGLKLMLSFAAILAVIFAFGALSLYSTEDLSDDVRATASVTARKLDLAGVLSQDIVEMRGAATTAVLAAAMSDPAEIVSAATLFRKKRTHAESTVAEIQPLLAADLERRAAATLLAGLRPWSEAFEQTLQLCATAKVKEANAQSKRNQAGAAEAAGAAEDLLSAARQVLAVAIADAGRDRNRSRWTLGGALAIALLIAAAAFTVVLRINRALRQVASELGEGAAQIASAASQMFGASQSLAQGSSEQASSLTETSASSEEITSMVRRNSENSQSAAELVTQSQQKVVETNRSLQQMIVAMGEISSSSGKISNIIKTIEEIAFQTNILALNAAVEAARAGEAGMGFAVVAEEVRNLAQRSSQAAKDTAQLIEESIRKSKAGSTTVDQMAHAIQAVTDEAGRAKALVEEVNLGSHEQARGIEQIVRAVVQMERVTQTIAANAEEGASAAAQLNGQAEVLTGIVNRLTAMVGEVG